MMIMIKVDFQAVLSLCYGIISKLVSDGMMNFQVVALLLINLVVSCVLYMYCVMSFR